MEWKPQGLRTESFDPVDDLLRRCFDLLTVQDFASCRKLALAVYYNFAPKHPVAMQAIAIAEVHIAAKKRLPGGQWDWYSILQVDAATPPEVVQARASKLLAYLDPIRNKFPFARNAEGLVMCARLVLSNPATKAKYDSLVAPPPTATFNTVCPYCNYMNEYEIVYKDHSLRCQTCRREFHAAAVQGLLPEPFKVVDADGRVEEANLCPEEQSKSKADATGVEKSTDDNSNNIVGLVSYDELTGHAGGGISSNGNDGEARVEEVRQEEQRPSKKMRVTSPAENTEKIMGREVEDDPVPVPTTPQADPDSINEVWSEILGDSGVSWCEELKSTFDEDDIYVVDLVGCMDDPLTSHLEQTDPEGRKIRSGEEDGSPFWVHSLDRLTDGEGFGVLKS